MQTEKRLSISRGGISLLEVLAAIFVVSIGLLGVLAVIPFGAFQVSKARHAEYASNMLANAAEEIFIREMAKPESWDTPITTLDCTKFVWVEPHTNNPLAPIFYASVQKWQEIMRGPDDLVYTAYDDKRPDFEGQNNKIQSSGKYTWFFTSLPKPKPGLDPPPPMDAVPLESIQSETGVDILACYNRVPSDDKWFPNDVDQAQPDFSPSFGGGTFTLPDASCTELLTQTKYVFVTWEKESELDGAWCKIVFLVKPDPPAQPQPKIVVTGNLPKLNEPDYSNIQVYIPSGVLYHKRLEEVPIK